MNKTSLIDYFNSEAEYREKWMQKNKYYHNNIEQLFSFIIPKNKKVIEIGCGTGDLLNSLSPKKGVGIDISSGMLEISKKKYPNLEWKDGDIETLNIDEKFEFIVLSDLIGYLTDIEKSFGNLNKIVNDDSRVVISYYNYIWEPVLRLAEHLHLKAKQPLQNWLSSKDIENMLYLSGFEIVKKGNKVLLPFYIPLVSYLFNKIIANFPLIWRLGLIQYAIARPISCEKKEYSVSVIIPARNEKGNIESAVKRTPNMGIYTELIFIEGHSTDDTYEEIKRVAKAYSSIRKISYARQEGEGKADAVRKGFDMAEGDILMILDADLTVMPEILPKFYRALAQRKGDFINGSRLVYQLEKDSMRILNIFGNKFFSAMFTYLLGQRIKDTLCGTKVLFKKDYNKIVEGRAYFGEFDPFGDYDLLFGAAKLNLKIVEMPIRYQARTYGSTNIARWKHGWLLLKMTAFALRKIKFV